MNTLNITHVNETKGYIFSEYTEDIDDDMTNGQLFRALQREYGRCISKMYRDTDQGTKVIGWVFQSRNQYDDCNESYLRETWAEIS